MTTQEENEAISIWAGLECRCDEADCSCDSKPPCPYYCGCPRHSNEGNPPDYDRDEVAVGLLLKFTDKKIVLENSVDGSKWNCYIIYDFGEDENEWWGYVESGYLPTIAAAIKTSILALLEKEKI